MEIAIKNNQRLIRVRHRTIEKALRRALAYLALKGRHALLSDRQVLKRLEVSVLCVNDDAMRRLNLLYRGIDKTTDVLSFPAISQRVRGSEDQKIRGSEGQGPVFRSSGPPVFQTPIFRSSSPPDFLLLGDIVISLPQAKRQAKDYGTTFNRELARLLVHGLLHLLGYDHEKNRYQAVKMKRMEAELAETLCR